MASIPCRFYHQGSCRYGQNCRFEHSNYGAGGNKQNYTAEPNLSLGVAEEILIAERGGQWILSCFGPFKEKECIPGMEDVSPEEVRWQMYQAQKDGTVEQVKLQYQSMCQAAKSMQEALKNPTPESAVMLSRINRASVEKMNPFANPRTSTTPSTVFGSSGTFGSTFAPAPGTSIFCAKLSFGATSTFGTTSGSVFGPGSTTTASVFSSPGQSGQQTFGAPSVFGGASQSTFQSPGQSTNVFARAQSSPAPGIFGSAAAAPPGSIFGAQTNTGLFGNNQIASSSPFNAATSTVPPSSSPFGAATSTAPASSIFGQQQTAQTFGSPSVFGSFGNPSFANANNGGVFSSPNVGNVFKASAPGSVFGAPTMETQGTFAQPAPSFAQAAPAPQVQFSSFGPGLGNPAPATQAASPFANSAFSNNATANSSPFGQGNVAENNPFTSGSNFSSPFATASVVVVDESMYSVEEALTDDEKNQFRAESFTFGRIPTKPPTKELR